MKSMTHLSRQSSAALALVLAIVCAGCGAQVVKTAPPARAYAEPALLRTLYTLDGAPWHASAFLQDTLRAECKDGMERVKIERVEYLVLVVSHTDCEWTRRFMTDAARLFPDFQKASSRIVLVLYEKNGKGASEWKESDNGYVRVLEDRDGETYRFYVRGKTPSISVVDRQANLVFRCDGYVAPEVLVQSLIRGEFSGVKGGQG